MSATHPIPILLFILTGASLAYGELPVFDDSVAAEKKTAQLHFRITPRIHTKGLFTTADK